MINDAETELCDKKAKAILDRLIKRRETKTYNKNCIRKLKKELKKEIKKQEEFNIIIDLDNLKTYVKVLIDNTLDFKATFKFNIELLNWDSCQPIILVKYPKKSYDYLINENEMRIKFLELLGENHKLPMNLLLDGPSNQMLKNKKPIISLLYKYLKHNDDKLYEYQLTNELGLNNIDDNNYSNYFHINIDMSYQSDYNEEYEKDE